jgi:hypothetical protein
MDLSHTQLPPFKLLQNIYKGETEKGSGYCPNCYPAVVRGAPEKAFYCCGQRTDPANFAENDPGAGTHKGTPS